MVVVMGVSGLKRNLGKKITLRRENEGARVITIYFDAELCRDESRRFFIAGGTERTIKQGDTLLDKSVVRDIPLEDTHRVYLGNYEFIRVPVAHGLRTYRAII